jgi:hypothetical protein
VLLRLPQSPYPGPLRLPVLLRLPQSPYPGPIRLSVLLRLPQSPYPGPVRLPVLLGLPQSPYPGPVRLPVLFKLPQSPYPGLVRLPVLFRLPQRPYPCPLRLPVIFRLPQSPYPGLIRLPVLLGLPQSPYPGPIRLPVLLGLPQSPYPGPVRLLVLLRLPQAPYSAHIFYCCNMDAAFFTKTYENFHQIIRHNISEDGSLQCIDQTSLYPSEKRLYVPFHEISAWLSIALSPSRMSGSGASDCREAKPLTRFAMVPFCLYASKVAKCCGQKDWKVITVGLSCRNNAESNEWGSSELQFKGKQPQGRFTTELGKNRNE